MFRKFKQIFSQIFLTHLGRIALGLILFVIGLIMAREGGAIGELIREPSNDIDWWFEVGRAGGILAFGNSLIFIVYGLIINPIRNRKTNK